MAEATMDAVEEAEDEGGRKSGLFSGKKKLVLIVVAVLLLAGGGVAAAHFAGLLGGSGETEHSADSAAGGGHGNDAGEGHDPSGGEGHAAAGEPTFFELPEFVVNLTTPGRRTTFFKLRAKVELASADGISQLEARMPRIVDHFQVYLRELRPEDLDGSAGTYRLREELLKRLRIDLAPVKVNDILFIQMLVQ